MGRQYVHITGFSRSGTTLLSNLFLCFEDVFVVPEEAARIQMDSKLKYRARTTITRLPSDALNMETMSRLLAKKDTHVVYLIRDPRDWLTSINRYSRGDDPTLEPHYDPTHLVEKVKLLPCFRESVDLMKYEDLVTSPDKIQDHFVDKLNLVAQCDFRDGYQLFPPEHVAQQKAMGEIRPLDTKGIGRWQLPKYRHAVEDVLQQNPILLEFVDEYGY